MTDTANATGNGATGAAPAAIADPGAAPAPAAGQSSPSRACRERPFGEEFTVEGDFAGIVKEIGAGGIEGVEWVLEPDHARGVNILTGTLKA